MQQPAHNKQKAKNLGLVTSPTPIKALGLFFDVFLTVFLLRIYIVDLFCSRVTIDLFSKQLTVLTFKSRELGNNK